MKAKILITALAVGAFVAFKALSAFIKGRADQA